MKNTSIKSKRYLALILLLNTILLNLSAQAGIENVYTLSSPSKHINVRIENRDGKLTYQVFHKKDSILASSRLSWEMNGAILGEQVESINIKKNGKKKNSYPLMGNHALAENRYRDYILNFREKSGEQFQIEFRMYTDGVAFRYLAEKAESSVVNDHTTFRLPVGTVCWLQPNARFYEASYRCYPSGELPDQVIAGPPVTIKYPSGVYASVTEGGLVNFGGMGLKVIAPDCFQSSLEGQTHLKGNIATPWRVLMIGDLNRLVNNDIVYDVSEPLSPVFQNNTDWIKPGNCVWSWLAGYGVTLENMKRFTDWASELGVSYNLVDEGWSHWENKEKGLDAWQMVADLVNYSSGKGVKILLWKAYPDRKGIEGIQTTERRRNFFRKCKELGIAGLKIDFFDKESQEVTRYYEEALKDAAEFGLVINFHGSNKPTGLNRTYPNELSREAIKGLEYGCSDAGQDVITPFTRFVAGHADYTPMAFEKGPMGNTTEAHQIAMTAVFLSPLRCYGGRPEDYLLHPARDLFLSVPTVWDETIVLPPSEIGECIVMARRKGKDWYVAALAGKKNIEIELPLAFLTKKSYKATVVSDTGKAACEISHGTLTRKDRLTIRMAEGGGFLAKLMYTR